MIFSFSVTGATDVVRINDNDWPPYFFKGEVGAPKGFGKEMLERCVPETGYRHQFSHLPIKRMWSDIQSGELDINIFSYRPGRDALLHYGKVPIYTASYRPVVRSSSSITINSLEDFNALKLGHLAGLKYSPEFLSYVEDGVDSERVHIANSNQSILRMLLAGRIDIYVNTSDTVLWNAKKLGVQKYIRVLDYDIQRGEYFVTLSRQSTRVDDKEAFLAIVDACLLRLKASGEYAEILNRYVLQP